MRLEAMAVRMPDVADHPNRVPFTGVLTRVDEPSTKPPAGARGHRVVLTRAAALAALPSLLGMAVDYAPSWDGHDARRKCGIITHADVEGRRLTVAGYLFAKDFPEVERQMRQCAPGAMGMSWELADAHVEDLRAEVWTLTNRTAAWTGKYTAWNPEQQGTGGPGEQGSTGSSDIWPGDSLSVSSASAGVTANLIIRAVQIDLTASVPALARYTISFANDWAEELSIKTSSSVPADAWLPQQPETTPPLASLNTLAVTSVTGSAVAIAAGVNAPTGGGFEVRRRDWAFTPGPGPDLVLRSPVPNFSIPRAAATEQYYIRMYDASTPPNYSRFSAAVFVNLPLTSN